jgi:hypothetical protein
VKKASYGFGNWKNNANKPAVASAVSSSYVAPSTATPSYTSSTAAPVKKASYGFGNWKNSADTMTSFTSVAAAYKKWVDQSSKDAVSPASFGGNNWKSSSSSSSSESEKAPVKKSYGLGSWKPPYKKVRDANSNVQVYMLSNV